MPVEPSKAWILYCAATDTAVRKARVVEPKRAQVYTSLSAAKNALNYVRSRRPRLTNVDGEMTLDRSSRKIHASDWNPIPVEMVLSLAECTEP